MDPQMLFTVTLSTEGCPDFSHCWSVWEFSDVLYCFYLWRDSQVLLTVGLSRDFQTFLTVDLTGRGGGGLPDIQDGGSV